MNAAAVFFYLFSGVAIASALMVIASRNPVHSVLFLILAFVNAAGLFILMGAVFLTELVAVVGAWTIDPAIVRTASAAAIPPAAEVTNTVALGRVLYTQYFVYFQLAGMILLVAMIGAIVLTLRDSRPGLKRQVISDQVDRTQATAVEVKKVPFRQGV